MRLQFFILFAVAVLSCHGQIVDLLFPSFSKTSKSLLNTLTKNPFVTIPAQISGNVLTTIIDTLAKLPDAATRYLGPGLHLPIFSSDRNWIDSLGNIMADYTEGLSNNDAVLDITQLIHKYGFESEEHEVETEDGFLLTVFRIPGEGTPVFLQHGLLGSADEFVIAGPESGLAYMLAREGYDVWMGNARGNKYSREHVRLEPSQAIFWDFSWHEVGYYDLPAMIDHILDTTNQSSVKYVGYSQGTTSFFVMASERPDYNEKIEVMIALSPVVFMSNVRSPIVRLMAPGTPFIYSILNSIGWYEFLPDDNVMRSLKFVVCGLGPISDIMCGNLLFLIAGVGYAQFNFTNLPVILGHTPAGASTKQIVHYGQGILSGEFKQFDYGSENVEKYGTEEPPSYAFEKITAPIALFHSEYDWLAHPADVEKLSKKLNNVIDIYKVPEQQFNHLDFVWAIDFEELIYTRLHKIFTKF